MAIEGDTAWVDTRPAGACGRCSARPRCGRLLYGALSEGGRGPMRACLDRYWAGRVRIHDTVELSLPEHCLLRAASLLYAVPLLTTLAAAVLADRCAAAPIPAGAADLQVAAAACAGFGLGLLLMRPAARRAEANLEHLPRVTGRS